MERIDYTARLRSRMQHHNIPSFRALARQVGVSDWPIRQLRQGRADQLRGHVLNAIALALGMSLSELLQEFSTLAIADVSISRAQVHQEDLDQLESWLCQWPTVVAAIAKNPDLPAARIVPLLQPVEDLVAAWGVEAIAAVGEVLPYAPQWHQLLEGNAQPGEHVRVRYVGYRYQGKLLFRAQVSPQS